MWYCSGSSSDFLLNPGVATLLCRSNSSKRDREILKCARLKLTAAHQPSFIPSRVSYINLPLLVLRKRGDFPGVFGDFSCLMCSQINLLFLSVLQGFTFICERGETWWSILSIRTHGSFSWFMIINFSPILAQIFQGFSERLNSACLRVVSLTALQTVVSCLHTKQVLPRQ